MAEANLDTVELTGYKPHSTIEPPSEPAPTPAPTQTPAPDPAPEPASAEPAAAEGAESAEAEPKPAPRVSNPFQTRIDKLTREKHDALRENAALALKVAQYEQAQKPADGEPAATPQVTRQQPTDTDTLINQRAQALYQQRVYNDRVNAIVSSGNAEYKDFTNRCNIVANLGGADRPDFMEIVTDPSIVPDGHKIIAALAENPDEAARILALPTIAMSAELARYAERVGKPAPKPTPISKVPAPIKPLSGSASVSDEPSLNDSEDDWFRKREAQRAARHQVARSL